MFLPSIHKAMKRTLPQSYQTEGKNIKPLQGMKDEISFNFLSLMKYLLREVKIFSRNLRLMLVRKSSLLESVPKKEHWDKVMVFKVLRNTSPIIFKRTLPYIMSREV